MPVDPNDILDNTEEPVDDTSDEQDEKNLAKQVKIEKEKKELLDNVLRGNLKTPKERVGYILNKFSESRNSDIDLAWKYWENFENEKFTGYP